MDIVEFGSLTAELRHELEGDEEDPFNTRGIALQFRPKDRHIGLKDDLGRLVASTGFLVVEVKVGRQRFPVVGFGGVIVKAEQRGRGLARQLLRAALWKAKSLGPAFAILFCHEDRAGLYKKFEFAEVNDEVVVRQLAGYVPMPQRTMWRSLKPDRQWPAGKLTVHGLPF
ncbi:MAG: GNAT family N-acetyltransferase [Solirubrobacterales bacterium]|nr:GNAT family N-acetyltransferase [Solirubrobacterales bacterium]